MGNCQAAEAATVVIQHPGNKIDRIYWSVSANEVMSANPGHYVALVVTSPISKSENGTPVKQLKLLRPDDTLLIGQVYRLISFEDVLKEFAAKKCVKLGKLLQRGGLGLERKKLSGSPSLNRNPKPESCPSVQMEQQIHQLGSSSGGSSISGRGVGRHHVGGGGGQWKPALQSIAEVGT
ncbi:uncharacterized protein LOC114271693 isoform X1 [Camellia sinensis]|uniref:DUF4228 domain-containing protein n=1 Tax=Camellia sinensis var. sinensis TaxID=542762 RepID=A0A4S4EEK2_CAMSN|nr:uncharacterized protein LOC114271693 isoform X1 [Camellia sinensis]THG14809.1 hypothetical protein TEA_018664 [Camellia sinensis var. sinensis]